MITPKDVVNPLQIEDITIQSTSFSIIVNLPIIYFIAHESGAQKISIEGQDISIFRPEPFSWHYALDTDRHRGQYHGNGRKMTFLIFWV